MPSLKACVDFNRLQKKEEVPNSAAFFVHDFFDFCEPMSMVRLCVVVSFKLVENII